MKIRMLQSSFVSGEISEAMYGRVDLDTYKKSAAMLRNVYVLPQGGVYKREGMQYIDSTTTNQAGRLISFEFNTTQTYLIVFTPGQFKVYKDDVLQATVSSAPISSLTATMIDEMNWTQSADTLILVHPSIQPIKITRSSHTSWTATSVTLTSIPQFDFGSGLENVISNTRGWVRAICFKYGRLWWCGLGSRPQTIISSKVGDYYNLSEGTGLDDEAINITIDDDRVNAIMNVFPGRSLHIFTTGGEFTIQDDNGNAITPGKIPQQLAKATLHGSNRARPVSVDGATIFVEGSGAVVRQFTYNTLEQSYNAPNVSILSPHLVSSPKRMDVRRSNVNLPSDYVYLVNDDGSMGVLNVLRDENLLAWTLFETDGDIEDVSVVGGVTYLIVKRNINGSDKRFIEKLNITHQLDCSVSQTAGAPQTAWSGYSHLNGESLSVRGDDFVLDNATPSGGSITSSDSVSAIEAGLFFAPIVRTLPAEAVIGGQYQSGEYKRLVSVNMRLLDTRGLIVEDSGNTYRPPFRRSGTTLLDQPIPLHSGWMKVYLAGYQQDSQVTITQDEPLEFKLTALQLAIGV